MRSVLINFKGTLPSLPYIAFDDVEFLTFKIRLQYLRCNLSMSEEVWKPHNRVSSKIENWHWKGSLKAILRLNFFFSGHLFLNDQYWL